MTVLHNFSGGADGANPYAGVTLDSRGNLYGTTANGGNGGGVVYKLTHTNSGWTFAPLYNFGGGHDAAVPYAGVVFGPDGSLYGTTYAGGTYDQGAVFNLKPPVHISPNPLAPWTEKVLYSFRGGTDGVNPYAAVTFDAAGNLYGTTSGGGRYGPGTVFELSPSAGGWTESVIYNFSGPNGALPYSNVIFDNAGNLYGTTLQGGSDGRFGAVYELTYLTGVGWAESFLYSFTDPSDGASPYAGLTRDASGHLYGATADGSGVIFELTPFNGAWSYSSLYGSGGGIEPCGALGSLVIDAAGNLYGATTCDGANGTGSIFRMTHISGGWTYTTLYSFSFTGRNDGTYPEAGVALDANGNLYGTTIEGGAYGNGVVWEFTP
ncbi:MAG TPA: choice-of-anchor tandem repeat GloVer-containing protein [Candidatus Binatia bacterium]|nr:choice-of-anchor tandem repeat GloVer-containing protein [Candidatus Binatia bacterium]